MIEPHDCATTAAGFTHGVFVHHGIDEYLAGVSAFIAGGLRAGAPVMAVVPTERLAPLHERLGDAAGRVSLLDMRILGHNPARLIPGFAELVRSQQGRQVWFVGEPVWPERSSEEIDEAIMHEALSNVALAGLPISGFCPYDAARLDPRVIAAARAAHPLVSDGKTTSPNPDYCTNRRWPAPINPLADPPPQAELTSFTGTDLRTVRRRVEEHAAAAGLDPDRRRDVVLAVNEITTNSVRFAGGSGELRLWSSRSRFYCEIRDSGLVEDPLSGRVQPEAAALSRRGLWFANQLCDLVQIRTGGEGTTVRLAVTIDARRHQTNQARV